LRAGRSTKPVETNDNPSPFGKDPAQFLIFLRTGNFSPHRDFSNAGIDAYARNDNPVLHDLPSNKIGILIAFNNTLDL
jgi:hypothetical protein